MKLYWMIILLAAVLSATFLFSKKNPLPTLSLAKSFSTDFAYDNRTFLPAVAQKKTIGIVSPKVLVLPHHLTASTLIADGIFSLTKKPPKTIIILSPNHANSGQCDIVTSKNNWDTPFGEIKINRDVQRAFLDSGSVCLDDDSLSVEHGIAGLLPFIKYFLPQTQIVPFALKKDLDPVTFNNFTSKLISDSTDLIVIASVDFSHGLSHQEALKHDAITEGLIMNFDYQALLKLSSEYLDSPASLVSVLKILGSAKDRLQLQVHADSSAFNGNFKEVTSYFLITGDRLTTGADTFTLVFGGDVMLGRSVNTRMIKYSDFTWPFKKISSVLSGADLALVNLESPFRIGCRPTDSGMVFCADPRSVDGLKMAGIDIVNLANNHMNNQGKEGISDSLAILSQAGIASVGQGQPYLKTIKNTKIAFLGFTDIPPAINGISGTDSENLKNQISSAKKEADLVIVTFHWGNEYSHRSLRQVALAHLAIDSGADVIIGHHPHWVQEIETYHDKHIYYSLGNLVFDQMWSEETKKGLCVKLTFNGKSLIDQEKIPIKIYDYGQPALSN